MARKPKKDEQQETPQLSASFVEEVEEELRQERLKKAWRRYGPPAAILAVAIVLGVFGWSTYTALKQKKAQEDSQLYLTAVDQIEAQNLAEAQNTLKILHDDAQAGYQFAAKMELAAIALTQGDKDAAIGYYQEVINSDIKSPYQNLALISAARITIGEDKFNQFLPQLDNLIASDYQMAWLAQEIKALNFIALDKREDAKAIFNLIIDAANVPSDIKQRANLMREMIEE